jgi:protein SCO1/2
VAPNSTSAPEAAEPATGLLKTFAASLSALLAALVVALVATDSGRSFTTEDLRRNEVARAPQPLPDFALLDAEGRRTSLHRLLAADGRVWIAGFMYTRCQSVCSALGSIDQQLQEQIKSRGLQDRVGLLSISFDPANDDVAALRAYAARLKIDPTVWRVVTLASADDRRDLLDAFGIIVIPAPLSEFEHNAALHVVDGRGRLIRIVDLGDPTEALTVALASTP